MLPEWYNESKNFIESSIKKFLDDYFKDNNISLPLKNFKESIYYSLK
jgi:hypothetical protein